MTRSGMPDARVIKVGIKTEGNPVLEKCGEVTLLHNMIIGDGFHWQKTIKAILPGEVIPFTPGLGKISEADRNITIINHVPLETYLQCVVGSEMNPMASSEFLKAHAVISRSWALGKMTGLHDYDNIDLVNEDNLLVGWDDTSGHHGFDVCSDDHCQRYQGLQEIPEASLHALEKTKGEILVTSEGKIVDARFSKCCGGETELFNTCWQNINTGSLESFKDPWCDLSGLSATKRRLLLSTVLKDYDLATEGYGFRWHAEVMKEDIEKNLYEKFNRNIGKIIRIEPLHRGMSGRIDLLRIHGSKGILDLGKELWIRRLLSSSHLYSSAFEIEDKDEMIRLSGRGWGHGVGLCQIGAAHMGASGYTYKEILSFYYPGSRVVRQ